MPPTLKTENIICRETTLLYGSSVANLANVESEDTHSPQCLHFRASAAISPMQNGHGFIAKMRERRLRPHRSKRNPNSAPTR
jgi:hypothetical protein